MKGEGWFAAALSRAFAKRKERGNIRFGYQIASIYLDNGHPA